MSAPAASESAAATSNATRMPATNASDAAGTWAAPSSFCTVAVSPPATSGASPTAWDPSDSAWEVQSSRASVAPIETSAAMPTAAPNWRAVLSTPEPRPARSASIAAMPMAETAGTASP